MKFLKTPTPEVIERALARLAPPGANAYFFDRLNNPEWVAPLYERGFFRKPPAADRSRNDGTVSFPDWPELRYLTRMAPLVPVTVGKIVTSIPDTDNLRVRQLQVEIGLHLGRYHSHQLVGRVVGWLDDDLMFRHFAEPVAKFIAHLAKLGARKQALRLARRLFVVIETNTPRRTAQLDAWHYERYLGVCLPALRECAPLHTVGLLRDLLLDSTREPKSGQIDDFSYIWRRDLSEAKFSVKQISDILIDALRDTSLTLSQSADIGFAAVRTTLLARTRRLILMRIAIFVAAHVCGPADPFVLETLLDMRLVDRLTCRAEYTRLLRAMFKKLPEPARQQVRDAILHDPLQSIPPAKQQELGPERLARLSRIVMRERLSAFGTTLPEDLTPLREELIAELGESHAPEAPTVWHGPTSPIPQDRLGATPLPQLIEYLVSWTPTHEFGSPSREGLARDLQQLAKNRAQEWAAEARRFIGLHPTYVRGILFGINDACTAKTRIDWSALLCLMRWVMAQPREVIAEHNAFDDGEDPDWSWTRQAIARLLTTALTTAEAGLEWDARATVWAILQELLEDPDPLPDSDTDDNDPLTSALNRVRGVAAQALFRFAWWIHGHLPPPDSRTVLTFDRMPEIRAGVELILNDPSPAVHSVLGDWFRTMFFFDARWTEANIEAIFPASVERRSMWLASWRAFADYDQPYDPAFDLLRRKYEMALERLLGASEEDRRRMGEKGLGQHLISYYWRGVGGEDTRQMLLRYFDLSSPEAAAHVLWSTGAGLETPEPIAASTIHLLANLWVALTQRASNWGELKQREVYRHFGRWFTSARFENSWALRELQRVLEIGAGILDVEGILARLEKLAKEYPQEVAQLLELLLRDEQQFWQPLLWQARVEAVLRALLDSSDTRARDHAETIVNRLVQNGGLFARDLLRGIVPRESPLGPSP